jgi:Amt family ammonium transporter
LSYVFMALIGVQWSSTAYSLSFGTDIGGLIGGLNFVGFRGVDALPTPTTPRPCPRLFAAFQMMFAVITPALITGAFVERIRFKSFIFFSLLWRPWSMIPSAHWVWGKGGWLREMGGAGFRGRNRGPHRRGVLGLAFAMVIGPRKDTANPHGAQQYSPDGLGRAPLVGWFGFNAGSALAANGRR